MADAPDSPDSNDDRQAQVEDAKTGLPLDLMTAVPGLNPRDMSVLIVGGLGKGITLNAGVDNGDGTATLLEHDLTVPGGLRMRFPPGASGPHAFPVTVISSDGHVRTGSLTVEPGLAALESGLRFSIEPPVVLDGSGRVGFPVAISFARGMGKMVGDVAFILNGVPAGVHLTGGVRDGAADGDGPWRLTMGDLRELSLIVPEGQGAFDVDLTVDARGQSGGRLKLTRQARAVPPGARAQESRPPAAAPSAGPKSTAVDKPVPPTPPVTDWLTGNGVFTFASGHGGDLFEGGYGWNDPAESAESPGPRRSNGGAGDLRLLAGGPVIDGPGPIVW